MVNSILETPNAERLHIAFFGRRNSGKSSIINKLSGQNISIVSDVLGTTTDPVYRAIEIFPIGPCVLIDTAGFDDENELGRMRVEKTLSVLNKTDIAVMVFSCENLDFAYELEFIKKIKSMGKKCVCVLNKTDITDDFNDVVSKIKYETNLPVLPMSAKDDNNADALKEMIISAVPKDFGSSTILGSLVREKDSVMLVMPQDSSAPKGRLILPQVQVTRELLDRGAVIISATEKTLLECLNALKKPPKLIITDSQIFKFVYENIPKESRLTSFSVLMANYKGDIDEFIKGANTIENLSSNASILIAESCSHTTTDKDIARVKIPNLLKKKLGDNIKVEVISGNNFPGDLSKYDLVIHCGGCMFNRAHVLSRVEKCKKQNVPVTNYGIVIAYLTGILNNILIKN